MKRMRWKNNERRYCSAAGQQQAATAELYATLPKAGAMLTSNRSRWVRNRNGIVKNERSTKTKKWKVVLAGSVLFFSGRSVVRGPSIRK